jgi:phage terminase large subunit
LEEATEFSLDDFTQIGLRIRDPNVKNQQTYLSLNPVSKAN